MPSRRPGLGSIPIPTFAPKPAVDSALDWVFFIIGGLRKKAYVSLGVLAAVALAIMFAGPVGIGLAPKSLFGVFERFSVFAATGFNAILGIYLFTGFSGDRA